MTTKEIKWDCLTPNEAETLATLEKSGKKVCAAPIEIEHSEQLEVLGITWEQVRTWYVGSKPVKVHPVPASEATAKYLIDNLRAQHRNEYRARRCMVPGKLKPLVRCPEHNRCSECPYPEYRDQHKTNTLSWDVLIGDGYEAVTADSSIEKVDRKLELEAVCRLIKAKNPKYLTAIVLKEYHGLNVSEIANLMKETVRNIYFYISEAKKIGAQYKRDNR